MRGGRTWTFDCMTKYFPLYKYYTGEKDGTKITL